jgi:hypothetical protein
VEEEYNMDIFKQIKSKSLRVIPLLLASCNIPGLLQEKNIIDFRRRSEDKYQAGLRPVLLLGQDEHNNLAECIKKDLITFLGHQNGYSLTLIGLSLAPPNVCSIFFAGSANILVF